jgi:hypothetical protein
MTICEPCQGAGWIFIRVSAPVIDGSNRGRMVCPDCHGSGKARAATPEQLAERASEMIRLLRQRRFDPRRRRFP